MPVFAIVSWRRKVAETTGPLVDVKETTVSDFAAGPLGGED
jgi:hypothetical protein